MKNRILIIILIFIFMLPVALLLIYSLSDRWNYPDILPESVSFSRYQWLAKYSHKILFSLMSSLFYSLMTVFLTFLISFFPAMVFARSGFRFKNFLESLLLIPALIPSMTFSLGLHYLFLHFRIADTMIGVTLVLALFSYPYMLRSLTSGFLILGDQYYQCARNLGAGFFKTLFQVELPMLLPAVISGGSVVFLVAFSDYYLVMLIGGGKVASYSGFLFPYLNSSDRNLSSLLTLIFLIIPLILFFALNRINHFLYSRRGIS